MKQDQQYKILKMVEEGVISAEQGRRLLETLSSNTDEEGTQPQNQSSNKSSPEQEIFTQFSQTLTYGFDQMGRLFSQAFGDASYKVKETLGMTPQNVNIKFFDRDSHESKYHLSTPIKVFQAFKGILTQDFPFFPTTIDWKLVFESLERDEPGKILEWVDEERLMRMEIWVE